MVDTRSSSSPGSTPTSPWWGWPRSSNSTGTGSGAPPWPGPPPTAIRATAADRALIGAAADATTVAEAARAALEGLAPVGDLHASGETRISLARTYLRRALDLAISRARNER